MRTTICLCFFILTVSISAQEHSKRVFENEEECLVYTTDSNHNYIPDFSYAGYKNGTDTIPHIVDVLQLTAIEGDNTAHIQAALDSVANRPADENGYRGAVFLNAGQYDIYGQLFLRASGVVLRGAGNLADAGQNTILRGIGNEPAERDLLVIGGNSGTSWRNALNNNGTVITNSFVPAGSRNLQLTSTDGFAIGTQVIVHHPSTLAWLSSINNGETAGDDPWRPGQIDIYYNRTVVDIDPEESKIILDVPIFDHFDSSLSTSAVYLLNQQGLVRNSGIENLRIDIVSSGLLGVDHVRTAIRLNGVEDCWVHDIVALHFSYAAVNATTANRVTVSNCEGLDANSPVDGGFRYNFAVNSFSNNILFQNCRATWGRHSFVSNGTSSASGIVWHNCQSQHDYTASEGHRRWSQGLLFDNIQFSQPEGSTLLGLYNRGSFGTGHGWAATHSVAWNVKMPAFTSRVIQQPPLRQNYSIGGTGGLRTNPRFPGALGFVELLNQEPAIPSLYQAQLDHRRRYGPLPDAPARLKVVIEGEAISLQWLDIASRERGYRIEYSVDEGNTYQLLTSVEENTTTYSLADVSMEMRMAIFRVYAFNDICRSPYSNPATLDPVSQIEVIPAEELNLFPNPVRSQFHVRSSSPIGIIRLFDRSGQVVTVHHSKQDAHYEVLSIEELPVGLYFGKIEDHKGRVGVFRMIKQ